jgi:hypothetical protein
MMTFHDGTKAATGATRVETTTTPERYAKIRELAETASRRLILDAKRELLLTALRRMVRDCYELDSRGRWLNIRDDGQLLIPAPWAAGGRRKWHMTEPDAEVLRMLLHHAGRRAAKQAAPDPAFIYAPDLRRWFVVLASYPTAAHALAWVDGWAAQTWTREALETAAEKLETTSPMGQKRARSGQNQQAPTRQALG